MKSSECRFKTKVFLTLLFVVAGIFIITANSFAKDDYEDVVYLKNGSIVRGMILEQVPNVSLKIETYDGSLFVYKFDEIEKITKEPIKKDKKGRITRVVPKEPEKYPLSDFLLIANPGGIIMNGPMLQLDMKLSRYFYLGLSARFGILGLDNEYHNRTNYYPQSDWNSSASWKGFHCDTSYYKEKVSLGFSLKLLPGNTKNRVYINLLAELGWSKFRKANHQVEYRKLTTEKDYSLRSDNLYVDEEDEFSFNPLLNIGYRLRFSPFIVNIGAYSGPLLSFNGPVKLLFMADLAIGYEF